MQSANFCQCCGMPMGDTNEMYGTNADGTKSEDYCEHCFVNGSFTAEVSMDEMIENCVPYVVTANPNMTEEEATKMMKSFLPTLKRWK